jgi:SulP family sulfate permease
VLGDLSGAVADLGIMVPLGTALILVNGLDAGAVFLWAGLLVVASGLAFGIPFPVQPLKALTAVAVARELAPGVIHAAGLEIAVVLLVLALTGAGERLARLFTKPIVRALQLGVGILLVKTAAHLVLEPPDVFGATPAAPWPLILAGAAFAVVWWAARTRRYVAALALLVVGVGITVAIAAPSLSAPSLALPSVALPTAHDLAIALPLLVLPQLPLTFGNAVVAVNDVARGAFGEDARRVTPARVCISCAAGNLAAGLAGGMPMCHGAGGLTAHVRLGARTNRMNLVLGGTFVALGLASAQQIPVLLGVLPVWVLGAFLAYAGMRHAWLIADLRGVELVVAVVAGAIGAYTGSLAWTVAIGLASEALRFVRVRLAAAEAG